MAEAITRTQPISVQADLLAGKEATNTNIPSAVVTKVALAAEASPSNGGMVSWQNPFDVAVLVSIVLDITTPATGAATADIGIGASAAIDDDTLIDGVDIGTAAGVFDGVDDQGTNGKYTQKVDAKGGTNDWVAGTASADSSGLVGSAYIRATPIS